MKGGLGFVRAYSLESSLQSISSNSSLWKRPYYSSLVVVERILTRQTCGHRSTGLRKALALGDLRALASYFPVRIWYVFLILKFRGECDLSLCITSALTKRLQLRSADFRRILQPGVWITLELLPIRSIPQRWIRCNALWISVQWIRMFVRTKPNPASRPRETFFPWDFLFLMYHSIIITRISKRQAVKPCEAETMATCLQVTIIMWHDPFLAGSSLNFLLAPSPPRAYWP